MADLVGRPMTDFSAFFASMPEWEKQLILEMWLEELWKLYEKGWRPE